MTKEELEISRLEVLKNVFGGDTKKHASASSKCRREILSFDQLMEAGTILPELEQQGKNLIKAMLGFIPESFITIPHEPYIRALINSYRSGMFDETRLYYSAEESIIPMRNAFVFYDTKIAYPQQIYQQYQKLYPAHKELIRNRITKLLGYEPDIGTSIAAELNLVYALLKDHLPYPGYLTPADFQAVQIIKYREVLLANGKQAADTSALPEISLLNLKEFPIP